MTGQEKVMNCMGRRGPGKKIVDRKRIERETEQSGVILLLIFRLIFIFTTTVLQLLPLILNDNYHIGLTKTQKLLSSGHEVKLPDNRTGFENTC